MGVIVTVDVCTDCFPNQKKATATVINSNKPNKSHFQLNHGGGASTSDEVFAISGSINIKYNLFLLN